MRSSVGVVVESLDRCNSLVVHDVVLAIVVVVGAAAGTAAAVDDVVDADIMTGFVYLRMHLHADN